MDNTDFTVLNQNKALLLNIIIRFFFFLELSTNLIWKKFKFVCRCALHTGLTTNEGTYVICNRQISVLAVCFENDFWTDSYQNLIKMPRKEQGKQDKIDARYTYLQYLRMTRYVYCLNKYAYCIFRYLF